MFLKICAMESADYHFEMKEKCKVSCVKIIAWSIVFKQSTHTIMFYIFKYGAKYGAECSAK